MDGVISINTHLKGVLGFIGVFDLVFFLIVDIWHNVQKGSTLRSMYSQIFAVYPSSSDLVNLCHNIWCNNSREKLFLGIFFCDLLFLFFQTIIFFPERNAVMSLYYIHYQ